MRCGNVFEDNDTNIMRGCKCGSIFFLYVRDAGDVEQMEKVQAELQSKSTSLEQEISSQISQMKAQPVSSSKSSAEVPMKIEYDEPRRETEVAFEVEADEVRVKEIAEVEKEIAYSEKLVKRRLSPVLKKRRIFNRIRRDREKFGVETVREPKKGVYEINLDGLMRKQPLVIMEQGPVFLIHFPSTFQKVRDSE